MIFLLIFFHSITAFSQNRVDRIYTNHNGWFVTPATFTNNPFRLTNSHELLAFRWGTSTVNKIYSTGVDNATLSNNGVTFENTKFKSLPIVDVIFPANASGVPIGDSFFFGFASNLDGNTAVAGTPPFTFPNYKISAVLNRGIKGMDLGSAIANVPSSTPLEFDILLPINITKVGDGVPDLVFTQQADPSAGSSTFDEVSFVDASGALVGNLLLIGYNNNTNFPIVGKWMIDFYKIASGTPASIVNTERDIRVFATDLSSFGINSTNITSIKKFKYKFNGSSDPGILSYNEETFTFLKAVDDVATAPTTAPITIGVLANDITTGPPTLTVFTPPAFGTATVVGNQIQYTPATGSSPNVVTFVYRICEGENCDNATVTINIPGGYCDKDFNQAVATSFTETGISSQPRQEAWPQNIPNGFLAMESKQKGFVITRVASEQAIVDKKEGMLIYDMSANCVKLFSDNVWNCIKRVCID